MHIAWQPANVAMLVGGAAAGAFIGHKVVAGSQQDGNGKLATIGGGIGGTVGGLALAKLAYGSTGPTSTLRYATNLLGVGAIGMGIGAAIAGALTSGKPAPSPTTPAKPEEPVEPTPQQPVEGGGDVTASQAMRGLTRDDWASQHLDTPQRAMLAASAAALDVKPGAASKVLQDLSSDPWIADTYDPAQRVQLAIAALEAGRSGAQAATTQVNVDGAEDLAGMPATQDLTSPDDRALLAQAAMRGGVDGATAAYVYAGIRNHDVEGIAPHEAARVTAAALEGGSSLDEALAAIDTVRSHPATKQLAPADQLTIAGGALRSRTDPAVAAEDFAAVVGDEWIGALVEGKELTSGQAARLAAAGTGRSLSGTDAALTFVNVAADDVVWSAKQDYEQVLDLSIGALAGQKTGAEAAEAFRAISAERAATAKLPVDVRFQLAAAAAAGDGADATIAAYAAADMARAFTEQTSPRDDAMLATGSGFDATSDSELLDWYLDTAAAG